MSFYYDRTDFMMTDMTSLTSEIDNLTEESLSRKFSNNTAGFSSSSEHLTSTWFMICFLTICCFGIVRRHWCHLLMVEKHNQDKSRIESASDQDDIT